MKKALLILLTALPTLLAPLSTNAQNKKARLGVGVSSYSNNYGACVEFDVKFIHLDISSNLASGEGRYVKYVSGDGVVEKTRWSTINIGTNIPLSKSVLVIPKIGYMSESDVVNYESVIKYYGYSNTKTSLSVGVDFTIDLNDYYIRFGAGNKNVAKLTVGVNLY